ncbi:uncharacterized protein LOC142615291 [Castanea sativa]|uniref:uncharacterized protein LOC142615291 n=1 Tax=Castanea sativa TaxID=21020 RepID=UPI003F64A06D
MRKKTSNWAPTCFSDEEHDIRSGESDYGHSDVLCTPINSEDDEEHPKYTEFRAEVDMPDPVFEIGMLFSDHKEFKRAVQSYRIKLGYPLLICKNESRKVSYKCKNCEWYIYASWDREENSLLVKTYHGKHTCSRAFHSRMVPTRWIAVTWLEVFRGRPNIKSAEIKKVARRTGFMEECRPIISLDTCHLRGFLKGQLLAAIGIDGNDGTYPIAFAVCEGKNKDSWSWFLELLLADIGLVRECGWTFISDQQKGLLPALAKVAPKAHTRFCVRHLYANFKKEHKGKLLKDLMWVAARETTKLGFEAKIEMMRKVDVNAYGHLMGIDCAHWSRHAFSTWPKCDMLLNNLCESFNSKIVDARDKSILAMCEMIRRYLIKRIPRNRDTMLKKSGLICPKIQDKLEVNKEATRDCTSTWSGGSKFEVHSIAYKKEKVENYVHSYYKVKTYLRTYSHLIQPTNGEDFWPNAVGDKILPPKMLVQLGRPKENKRKKAVKRAGGNHVFIGLRVEEDHHPPSVAGSQSTIVSTQTSVARSRVVGRYGKGAGARAGKGTRSGSGVGSL